MNNNANKNVTLSIIGVALLVIAVVGVSFAFFSYYGTASDANTLSVGQIYFSADHDELELTDAFPTTATGTYVDTAVVKIQGNTDYENGIDFKVLVAEDAVDATNGKLVPTITVAATQAAQDNGITITPKTVNATTLTKDTVLAEGKIPAGANIENLTEVLTIKAYYDSAKYHISNITDAATLKGAGLLDQNFNGTIILQDDWSTYAAGTAYSFSIRVVATEGAA